MVHLSFLEISQLLPNFVVSVFFQRRITTKLLLFRQLVLYIFYPSQVLCVLFVAFLLTGNFLLVLSLCSLGFPVAFLAQDRFKALLPLVMAFQTHYGHDCFTAHLRMVV